MQLSCRRLVPGEIDRELLGLSISLGGFSLAVGWLAIGLPWPHCLFHDLTGFPCVTCGMTRSAIQFFHGHFLAALRWNPLIFAGLCALSVFNCYASIVLIARAPRLRMSQISPRAKIFSRTIIITLLLANWSYLLAHWRAY